MPSPSFLVESTRVDAGDQGISLGGDKLAIGAAGSFGASSNKGVGEINSFSGAGPATLPLSIATSPHFSNWSGDDRKIDNTRRVCTKLTDATVRLLRIP